MNKIISLILLSTMLLSTMLTSCKNNAETPPAVVPGAPTEPTPQTDNATATGLLVYKNNAISSGIFLFLLSQTKSSYLYSTTGKTEENTELWEETGKDGKTVGKALYEETLDSALSILYFATLAQENNISLTDKETKEITTALDTMVQAYGTRMEFNNEMMKYGAGYNSLRDFYKLEKLAQKGAALVLDEKGTDPIKESDIKDYYQKNFITLRHLYLNSVYKNDGSKTELNQAEKDAVSARADEIILEIQNGAKLSDFKDETDDGLLSENPDGITIPLGQLLDMYSASSTQEQNIFYTYYYLLSNVKGFAEAALTKKTGEVTRVDNEKVGIFLVERTPLNMKMYDSYKDAIREFIIRPNKMSQIVTDLRADGIFTIDEKELSAFSIKNTPILKQVQMPK